MTKLSELHIDRVEKIASDIRMMCEDWDVEVVHKEGAIHPYSIRITIETNIFSSVEARQILSYAHRRELGCYIAIENSKLRFVIF